MRKYESLKKTYELWYKEIPSSWEIIRLKDITRSISSGATPSSGNALYYDNGSINWLNTGDLNDGIVTNTTKKLNKVVFNDYPNLKIQKKGTLVIAMYGATIGKLGLLDIEATTNQACCCLNLYNSFNSKYYFYLLLSNKQNIISLSVGGTQPNVSQSILSHIRLISPPFDEQQTIANYLDAKTSAIDKKVTLLELKIETYKKLKRTLINQTITKGLRSLSEVEMKDSGISWIGQIPQHWEVKRLKELGNIETSSINKKIEEGEDLVKLVNYTDVYCNLKREVWNNDNYMVVSANKLQKTTKRLKQGDVLFTPSSETINDIGVSAVVMEDLQNTLYSYHLLRLRFKLYIDLNFKKYLFTNDYVQYYFSKSATGTTRKILGLNTFYNLEIPIPPKSEQEEIANYLDHKTATIDAIISNISKQIETLKQLRKTLINDVVTGKIKVIE